MGDAVDDLRRSALALFLATDEKVAQDHHDIVMRVSEDFDRLTAERDALVEQLQAALALGTIAAAERDAARADAARLREALVEITDTRPCEWYGRHCITHGEKRPCAHGDAQDALTPPPGEPTEAVPLTVDEAMKVREPTSLGLRDLLRQEPPPGKPTEDGDR